MKEKGEERREGKDKEKERRKEKKGEKGREGKEIEREDRKKQGAGYLGWL